MSLITIGLKQISQVKRKLITSNDLDTDFADELIPCFALWIERKSRKYM